MVKISKPRKNLVFRLLCAFTFRLEYIVNIIRYKYITSKFKKFGDNITLDHWIVFNNPSNISISNNVFIGRRVIVNAYAPITIGSGVAIAASVKIISGNHPYGSKETIDRSIILEEDIVINNDVWIGYNVIILPGVTIGKNSVIAAGAVVTSSIPDNCLAGGVPARIIRNF